MNHWVTQIKNMHKQFGINYEGPPRRLSSEEKTFRVLCLDEELNEYEEAETMTEEADALVDLIVFALGSLERHGYPADGIFNAVMNANSTKQLAEKKSDSKRSFELDLIKPKGWLGPEKHINDILTRQETLNEKR